MNPPPLPETLSARREPPWGGRVVSSSDETGGPPGPTNSSREIQSGCWLVGFEPILSPIVAYDGTIRVESVAGQRTASGDLYQREVINLAPNPASPNKNTTVLASAPNPADGIPIHNIDKYRYYVRVTKILEGFTNGNSFELGLEMWRFNKSNRSWTSDNSIRYTATMVWIPAPAGYPSPENYLEGDLKDKTTGAFVGRIKMGWISSSYRKATIEIDTVPGSEPPMDNGDGQNWQTIFDTLGWDVKVNQSDTDVEEPSGESWSNAEMHAAMLKRRDRNNLDDEWRYHILAVKQLDDTPRGIMYDAGATDSDKVPREGVGISSHWIIPSAGPENWGLVRGLRFGTAKAPYFRTAVHELGHAFGLFHNTIDLGFMNTSDSIARRATTANPFPNNIRWAYAEDDLKRLRHYPDLFIRPGGVQFGGASETTPPITPTGLEMESQDLRLNVSALKGEVPLGAPVRITISLTNVGSSPVRVPVDISLKSDAVEGTVKDSAGTVRTFSPLIRCADGCTLMDLLPGQSISASLCLMRGREGSLFPGSGIMEIAVCVRWTVGDSLAGCYVVGKTTVLVTGAYDESHAAAAHRILTTPDAHLVLVFGGDHLHDGLAAIQQALADDTLRPHFASIEAKRLSQSFYDRNSDVDAAARLLNEADIVMTDSETRKLDNLFRNAGRSQTWARGRESRP